MRFNTVLVLAAATLTSSLALADVPPPMPVVECTASTSTTIAGLHFILDIQDEPNAQERPNYMFMSSCISTHANCRLAKQKGVIGWAVTAVNGAPVITDLGAFDSSFHAMPAGQKVRLTLEYIDDIGTSPKVKKLIVSFDPQ
jgi:hypothetical protein